MECLKEIPDIDFILGSIHHVYGMPLKKMKEIAEAEKARKEQTKNIGMALG